MDDPLFEVVFSFKGAYGRLEEHRYKHRAPKKAVEDHFWKWTYKLYDIQPGTLKLEIKEVL